MIGKLFIIKSGAVKIYRHQEGREIILAIFNEGDFFGEMVLFGDEKVRSASANTLEKSTVYIIKKEHFLKLLNRNPAIFMKILNTALERLRKANELIANLLIRLTEDQGKDRVVGLKLTHNQMADMTATARETVTKILSDMQNRGYIRIVNRQISIHDLEGLKSSAGLE
ncbi:Crp/Fnr family transcriptional regulator [Brevibacillus invocatus]|uniref:Crp/Fnr family transcriptional regulator n=1 Tax=Brevibacillus invocatus TaxID=173959 RepID=UPI00203C7D4B|nr:Crp/Fnr family transcriptional regulator [Brevibacillus invocatus]MCM3432383.1 Crp/Fnr family transcriptional regulator [Brevibacillus invocatus]